MKAASRSVPRETIDFLTRVHGLYNLDPRVKVQIVKALDSLLDLAVCRAGEGARESRKRKGGRRQPTRRRAEGSGPLPHG